MSNEETPSVSIAELQLNPIQTEALNVVGLLLQGKYQLAALDLEDHSKFAIVNPDNAHQSRGARINDEGDVVMLRNKDGGGYEDIPDTKPMSALNFGVITLSYNTLFGDASERVQNQEFLETARFGVLTLLDSVGIPMMIEVIRSGAREQGLLPDA